MAAFIPVQLVKKNYATDLYQSQKILFDTLWPITSVLFVVCGVGGA